jgi:hypothetical protein
MHGKYRKLNASDLHSRSQIYEVLVGPCELIR